MKRIEKKKLYMVIGVIVLIIAIAGSAYAYYSALAVDKTTVSGTVAGGANLDLKVEKISSGATESLIPVDNDTTTLTKAVIGEANTNFEDNKRCIDKNGYTACQIYKITLTNKSSVSVNIDGGVSLSGDNTPNIECAKMDNINTVSNNNSCKGNKTLAKNYNMNANESVIYYIMIYIKNINSAQTDTGEFTGTVFFNVSNGNKIESDFSNKETLSSYITNLYTNASKTPAENNGIDYNYAPDESLMNDRLGGTTTSLDGGNIRYYGASPNNYIYFNCSDYLNQSDTTCEKWRIIGVFNNQVKIIRNEQIGAYSWDTNINEWPEAKLMKLLNPGYETESVGGSLYYNSSSGTCYNDSSNATTTCNFTSSGIKNKETRDKIAKVTWNLGGWNSSSIFSNQIYEYERGDTVYSGNSTVWTGRIALAYPSDYGYAVDFNSCSKTLIGYADSTCTSNNWMKTIITNSGNGVGWLLTPGSGNSGVAWFVAPSSFVNVFNGDNNVDSAHGVAPTLYLSSDETIVEGTSGTEDNPYKLNP